MKKLLGAVVTMLLFTFGSLAPVLADPGNGANKSGDFDSTPSSGDNQGNGNAPENGSVGNADDKNPPGQAKNDNNNGYECDNNKGVGNDGGNPAHTGCVNNEEPTTTTTVKKHTPPTTVKEHKTEVLGEQQTKATLANAAFETKLAELKAAQVAGVTLTPEQEELVAEGELAYTGFETEVLLPIGLLLVGMGYCMVRFSRRRTV